MILEGITGFFGLILYPLFSVIFTIIDILQSIFGAFAGIDDIVYNGQTIGSGNAGLETDTGIVYFLLTSETVLNVFFSMLALAIILLLIFLVMAFIRNVYSAQTKNWKEIVGLAIKGIGNFVIIPVGALLGIWLGNIVLQAINGATASGNSMSISRQLFVSAAYNANLLRGEEYQNVTLSSDDPIIEEVRAFCAQYGITVDTSQTDPDYYADCIDDAYGTGGPNITWWGSVDDHYSLWEINYLILGAGGIFILYVLGALSFGMVKRLFMLLLLFIISPIVCAMYPIDNGSAAGNWRKTFLKHTISAYSAVAGVNLFFALLPIIQNIEFADGGATGFDVMGLTSLLLLIAGLYMVKEFIGVVNSFVGAEDAYATGAGLMSSVGGRVRKGMGHATSAAKKVGGAFAKAGARAKTGGAGSFFKSLGGSMVGGIIGTKDKDGNRSGGLLNAATKKMFGVDVQSITNEISKEFNSEDNMKAGKKDRALRTIHSFYTDKNGVTTGNDYDDDGKQIYTKNLKGQKIKQMRVYTQEEIEQLAQDAGILDAAQDKVAKAHGAKTKEDLDNDKTLAKAIIDSQKSLTKANAKTEEIRNNDTIILNGNNVTLNAEEMNRMFSGQHYSGNDISEQAMTTDRFNARKAAQEAPDFVGPKLSDDQLMEKAAKEAEEIVARRQAINRRVDEYQEAKQSQQSAADAMVQAMQKAQKEGKTDLVSIDNASIESFKKGVEDALNKNQNIETVAIDKVLDEVSKVKETLEKDVVKGLKNSTKELLKESEKGGKSGGK